MANIIAMPPRQKKCAKCGKKFLAIPESSPIGRDLSIYPSLCPDCRPPTLLERGAKRLWEIMMGKD